MPKSTMFGSGGNRMTNTAQNANVKTLVGGVGSNSISFRRAKKRLNSSKFSSIWVPIRI